MNIYKNSDVAKKYNVSSSTVGLLIKYSRAGKNNIQLQLKNKKYYIIDNPHNDAEVSRIVEENKKYRSNITCKRTKASEEFYKIFDEEEIIEILTDLKFKKRVKFKYSYKDAGASYWDSFFLSHVSPIENSVEELLDHTHDDLTSFFKNSDKINLIDIGPGNGYPVKNIIKKIYEQGKFSSYIPIDISNDINRIAIKNITSWFKGVKSKGYELDIENAKFSKIFLENKYLENNSANLIVHLGNTFNDHDDRVNVLKDIRNGIQNNDLLMVSTTLDNSLTRSDLKFFKTPEANTQDGWLFTLLGIDTNKCEFTTRYESNLGAKTKNLKLDKDYVIKYDLFGKSKEIELFKGEEINTWVHKLITIPTLFQELEKADLQLVSLKIDNTSSNALFLCQAKQTQRLLD